jgi:hypothetical protein
MSPLVKAALFSAAAFVLLTFVGVFVFVTYGSKKGPATPVEQVAVTPAEPAKPAPPPVESVVFTEKIQRDGVAITIEVVEKGRKRKLAGARAMILKANDGDRPGDKAWESGKDSSGTFQLELEPGAYVARIQCPRYTGQKRTFTVVKESPQTLVFELERGNSITGRVLAKGGGPIAGARVLALRELTMPGASLEETLIGMIGIQEYTGKTAFAADAITAADGTYSLDGLEVFAYTVRATANSFSPTELTEIPAPRAEVDIYLTKGGDVGGIVKDTSGNPVAGATVSAYSEVDTQDVFKIIMNKARPPVDAGESNGRGAFKLTTLGPGVYNFLIEAKGYQRGESLKVRVTPGQTNNLAFTLKPGETLRGTITGPTGEPVAGVKVRFQLAGTGAAPRRDIINISFDEDKIVTDAQGEFQTDTLEEGTYTLLCWHQDYQTLRKNDVRVGPATEDLQLKLQNGGRIRGTIREVTSGKPIVGARLSASDIADVHKEAVSEEDGSFVLAGLSAQTRPVTINVTADGFARAKHEVKVEDNREVEQDFEMQATGVVVGRVVNTAGQPVAGARVMAKKQSDSGVDQTLANDLTDRDGKFELKGIESGSKNWIRVKKGEYLDGNSDAFDLEPSQSLELSPIVLELGGSVGGKVVSADGKPLDGSLVIVTNEGETEIQQGGNPSSSTNARGEFLIQGLNAGTVDLVVKASHHIEKRMSAVEVKEGVHHGNIVIELDSGNTIEGVVVDTKGTPVEGAELLAKDYSQGVKELHATTGGDGHFVVEGILANDQVELEVRHDNFALYSDSKARVGTKDMNIVMKEHGRIQGNVVTSDGKSVESFTVQAQNPNTKDPRKQPKSQTFTNADGGFEYKGVPGGNYTLYIRAPQFSATTVPNVKVVEGETLELGQIVLQSGGRVTGKVIDSASKRPVEGARVQITQGSSRFVSGGAAPAGGLSPNPVQSTAADGSFAFAGLKGGALSLRILHDSYVSRKIDDVNPDVADKSQDLVIELDQGGEIIGSVLDQAGKPLAGMNVYLIGEDTSANQTQPTDKTGKFHFMGVTSGTFTVKAHRFGTVENGGPVQAEATVDLAPGETEEVNLQLE